MKISIQHVSKVFKGKTGKEVQVLKDATLEIKGSEFVSIIGPSGCGKSTLLYIVSNLEQPSEGKVQFEGERTSSGPLSAIVWQEYALMPWRTALDNVVYGLELRGAPKQERKEKALRYIELMGVLGFEDYFPHQLSGGMRQRVGIARALACDPEFLLMDEPFAAVDAQTRILLQQELLNIWEQAQKTVLFITHSIEEAIVLSNRIVIMTRRPGTVKEILEVNLPRPRNMEVQTSESFNKLRMHIWLKLQEEFTSPTAQPKRSAFASKESDAARRTIADK